MTHDAELKAAAYLGGEFTSEEREAFEAHLLECEECWREVESATRGRRAAERVREVAPGHLRERVRYALVSRDEGPDRRPPRMRLLLAAAVFVVVAGALSVWVVPNRGSGEPAVMDAAVAGYAASRLPGASTPADPGPDLSEIRLTAVGAGAGDLAGLPVDAYAFRDQTGRRLMVYIGHRPFPMADGARTLNGTEGPWLARHEGTSVLCARYPHELLIVGKDETLVRDAAKALDVM